MQREYKRLFGPHVLHHCRGGCGHGSSCGSISPGMDLASSVPMAKNLQLRSISAAIQTVRALFLSPMSPYRSPSFCFAINGIQRARRKLKLSHLSIGQSVSRQLVPSQFSQHRVPGGIQTPPCSLAYRLENPTPKLLGDLSQFSQRKTHLCFYRITVGRQDRCQRGHYHPFGPQGEEHYDISILSCRWKWVWRSSKQS